MSGGVYGGDEVGALVFDPGHQSMRVGYAGEDCPKTEIPSAVGLSWEEVKEDDGAMDTGDAKTTKRRKFHVDTGALNFAKAGMDVATYLKDGMIEDWDMLEKVLDYSYDKVSSEQ